MPVDFKSDEIVGSRFALKNSYGIQTSDWRVKKIATSFNVAIVNVLVPELLQINRAP